MILSVIISLLTIFTSPVHIPIELAGNFGEPRPNHFHGGIDVKTERCMGLGIYSIGDGYVSHITVSQTAFGRAIYIRHPEGYTSVYCHLSGFAPHIRHVVEHTVGKTLSRGKQPMKDEECEIELRPGELMISQGQFIARSGDSGSSQAPHLHLEIHDTKWFDMLDPQDFLGNLIKDTVPPLAHSLMVYPQTGLGLFNGSQQKQTFGFTTHNLQRDFTAWGKVGFGLWAVDFSGVTYNRLGIRKTVLLCDGDTVFISDVDRIPVTMNRQINSWGDYEHYLRTHIWYLRSYQPKGITLPHLQTGENFPRGLINFNQERDYILTYILSDIHGNKSEYNFTVRGRKDSITGKALHNQLRLIRCDRTYNWSSINAKLTVPQHSLGEDFEIQPKVRQSSTPQALSDTYSFASSSCPLFRPATLWLRINNKPTDTTNLIVKCDVGLDQEIPILSYKEGWVEAPIRELSAHYYVTTKTKN